MLSSRFRSFLCLILTMVLLLTEAPGIFAEQSGRMPGTDTVSDSSKSANPPQVQQYIYILDELYANLRDKIEKYQKNTSYEGVFIHYKDDKNDSIYDMYDNEKTTIEADNNIKEILCMAMVLFGFNGESYNGEYNKTLDKQKLLDFLRRNGIPTEEYESKIGNSPDSYTYWRLIRSYIIALFNASHKISERIEIQHCEGCQIKADYWVWDVDEFGHRTKKWHWVKYCPGHKYLHVTVTTYYFDKLFDLKLSKKPGKGGGVDADTSGSEIVEMVWNAMTSIGCSDEAAAAVIGNLMGEGGGGPDTILLHTTEIGATDPNRTGIGMCQWTGSRNIEFRQFVESKGETWPDTVTAETQVEFLVDELESGRQWMFAPGWPVVCPVNGQSMNISFEEFKELDDVEFATWVFSAMFERPNFKYMPAQKVVFAENVYNDWAS